MKEVMKRASSPTPAFFRKLRNIGLLLTSLSAALLGSPGQLPPFVVTIAGYAAVGGAVLSAVCQLVKKNEQ
ncbi:MAG: hypothetical protein V4539_23750 [Bacteroidota bacterium]